MRNTIAVLVVVTSTLGSLGEAASADEKERSAIVILKALKAQHERETDSGEIELVKIFGEQRDMTVEDLRRVSALPHLQKLMLLNSNDLDDEIIQGLDAFPNLQRLSLHRIPVTDRGLTVVGKLKSLRTLGLDATKVTSEGLSALSGLSELEDVNLSNSLIDDGAAKHIRKIKNLQMLYLHNTKITDKTIRELKDMPHLIGLSLNGTKVTDASIPIIMAMPSFKNMRLGDRGVIGVRGTAITKKGLAKLRTMKNVDFYPE